MFENVGAQLKVIAKVAFVIELIAAFILAIIALDESFWLFLISFVVGALVAYLSVITLYAFGELVENSAIIARNTMKDEPPHKREIPEASISTNDKSSGRKAGELWRCPNCGGLNYEVFDTCGCGTKKP